MLKLLATLFFTGSLFFSVKPQDFVLDSTFATNGTYFNTYLGAFDACKIQPDGKTLLISQVNGSNSEFLYSSLIRLDTNGNLDMSFGSGGLVYENQLQFAESPENIILQSDGKILVCGQVNISNSYKIAIARYTADGNLDFTFGTNGLKIIDLNSGTHEWVGSAAIQSDGKIIVCGSKDYDFVMVRLTSDGTIDNTFGNAGIVLTDFDNTANSAETIKLYPDGKIVVVGWSEGGNLKCAVARYDSNGNLDNTFNSTGKLVLSLPVLNYVSMYNLAIQGDGKILISQTVVDNGKPKFGIFRINTNGTLDNTFGTNGVFMTSVITNTEAFSRSFTLQNDGKIVIVGYIHTTASSWRSLAIAKVTSNGMLDTTFDTDGMDTLTFNNLATAALDVVVDNNGKIIVCGYNEYQGYVSRFILSDQPAEIKEEKLAFSISPNPTSESVTITSSKEIIKSIILTNSSGEIIKQFEINKLSIDVNLKDLPDGIYFVKIETNSGRVSQKIIKN